MKRKIISIDEMKCTGCGQCIPDCPEGALQIIEGKARLVSDLFCDGLGACIGTCPEGAISVIEREAVPYDEKVVMATIVKQGVPVIKAHLEHLAGHGQLELYAQAIEYLQEKAIGVPDHRGPVCPPQPGQGGRSPFATCPGSAARSIPKNPSAPDQQPPVKAESELRQWPVQLSLLNSGAQYFDNADLLIAADCVPFAYAGFHQEFLRGRIVIIFCPKLDQRSDDYAEKLAEIFRRHKIRSITVAKMEVPCCGGTVMILQKALELAGKQIAITVHTVGIDGLISTEK